jgi:hypothetical protein
MRWHYPDNDKWNIKDEIKAFSFDTTVANTVRMNGVSVLLEEKLRDDVLYLACHHHIHEIMLEPFFSTRHTIIHEFFTVLAKPSTT